MLAGYLVPVTDDDDPLDLDEIRAHAASVLPEYMVPSAFAVIPEIPLTVSGKLDKRALPAPTPVAVRGYREPATATERRMCSIFARLFGWERVGPEDSFFGLGGHSLLAARLVAAAAPAQILASSELHDELPDWPAVARGPLNLKGFDTPVTAFELHRGDAVDVTPACGD